MCVCVCVYVCMYVCTDVSRSQKSLHSPVKTVVRCVQRSGKRTLIERKKTERFWNGQKTALVDRRTTIASFVKVY